MDRVKTVQGLNKNGEFPEELLEAIEGVHKEKKIDYLNVVGQDDLTRFDKTTKKRRQKNKRGQKNKSNQINADKRDNQNSPVQKGKLNKNKKTRFTPEDKLTSQQKKANHYNSKKKLKRTESNKQNKNSTGENQSAESK